MPLGRRLAVALATLILLATLWRVTLLVTIQGSLVSGGKVFLSRGLLGAGYYTLPVPTKQASESSLLLGARDGGQGGLASTSSQPSFIGQEPIIDSANDSSPYSFSNSLAGFTDLLDTRLLDIIKDVKKLGLAFSRLALRLEEGGQGDMGSGDRSFKSDILDLLSRNMSETPEYVKPPLRILLLGTWSSGSTFLTKLITHYPGTFLNFEPMVLIKGYGAVEDDKADLARRILEDIFRCNYTLGSQGAQLLRYLKSSGYKKWPLHNIRLRNVCEGLANTTEDLCLNPDYTAQVCRLHPIQLVKTVRLRVSQVESLLQRPNSSSLRIIALFRDPRAVRSSRLRRKSWCKFSACSNISHQCGDQDHDYKDAARLARQFPSQVSLVKYEELATWPKAAIPKILQFLGLPWHPAITKFMAEHMVEDKRHSKEGDLHTQSVNSSQKTDSWRKKMTALQIKEVAHFPPNFHL